MLVFLYRNRDGRHVYPSHLDSLESFTPNRREWSGRTTSRWLAPYQYLLVIEDRLREMRPMTYPCHDALADYKPPCALPYNPNEDELFLCRMSRVINCNQTELSLYLPAASVPWNLDKTLYTISSSVNKSRDGERPPNKLKVREREREKPQ